MMSISLYGTASQTVTPIIEPITLARAIVDLISDKKGEKIVLSDLRALTPIADYFVIGEAASDRQINALVEHVRDEMKKQFGLLPIRIEGRGEGGWVLMDYGSVVVHLFDPDVRAYYDLEGLWREAPILMRMQ
jgi:ribosome-associated protein